MRLGLGISLTRSRYPGGLDPDAAAYIAAVEAADAQALESGVKAAYDTFIRGCKDDGIWDAIKASCILAGARTLSGALVPLKGTAPTNFNFVSGDYDRETGLVGDGSTKYLDSNRANNADPQDDQHMAVHVSTAQSSGVGVYIGASGLATTGASHFGSNRTAGDLFARNQNTAADTFGAAVQTGFFGMSRALSSAYDVRHAGATSALTQASQTPSGDNVGVLHRIGAATGYSDARLAFYSIGESLDLAALDSRVSTLISDLAAAIP